MSSSYSNCFFSLPSLSSHFFLLVQILAVQICAVFASDPIQTFAKTPLEELQELSDAGLPTTEFEPFEAIDLSDAFQKAEAETPEGYSLIEDKANESAETETEQQAEADAEYPVVVPISPYHSVVANVEPVQIPVVNGEQAREMEFARIQYLQAAIASKRDAILSQKRAILAEEAQIRRETKLVNLNRAILARNEAQIDKAQKELAKLVESYSRGLRAGFKVDRLIDNVQPTVRIPRPVIQVPVAVPAKPAAEAAPAAPAAPAKAETPAAAAPAAAAPAAAAPAAAFVEVDANLDETQEAIDAVMSLDESAI